MQMGLVAGRDLQSGGLDLDETTGREPDPQCRRDAAARRKIWPAGGMRAGQPKWRAFAHIYLNEMALVTLREGLGERLASAKKIAMVRPETPPQFKDSRREGHR